MVIGYKKKIELKILSFSIYLFMKIPTYFLNFTISEIQV
ncbi:hypothetical protein BCAH1134_C0705 (plasmid) [Bacillus cereus AH1134]|nr:hypothetical protein BCAH1134_C0705 [Bacillus cereus AH1134]